jgi:DNA-binding protein H-NS
VILADELGYSCAVLVDFKGPKTERGPSTTSSYYPENTMVTWSGRERKPGWFAANVNAGKRPNELLG